MYGPSVVPSCDGCNCPTGECWRRATTATTGNAWVTISYASTESREERERREAIEEFGRAIAEAYAYKRRRTREGWLYRPPTPPLPPRRVLVFKDFQRRPGRPTRHRGHGGPRPIRSRTGARARL